MELLIDTKVRQRQQIQLQQLIKTRSQCYIAGASSQRAAYIDNHLSALLIGSIYNDCLDDSQASSKASTADSLDFSSPEKIFVTVSTFALQGQFDALNDFVMQLQTQWSELPSDVTQAVAEAIIMHQLLLFPAQKTDESWLKALYSPKTKSWFQYLCVFLKPAIRQRCIPEQANWIDSVVQPNLPLSLGQAQSLINDNSEFFSKEQVGQAWALIFCDPSAADVQQYLLTLEQVEPDTVYALYGAWGLPWCLERIAEGLNSVRTNAAAYKQWLFLTQNPLPEAPILQEVANSDEQATLKPTSGLPVIAHSESAQQYLVSLKQRQLSDIHHQTAQKLRLTDALLTHNDIQQELYALALMQGTYATSYVSTRHGYRHHLMNLSATMQLSNRPWWAQVKNAN